MMLENYEATELLNFDYNGGKSRRLLDLKRILTIAFAVISIYALLPLLPVAGQAYTADAASPSAVGKTIDEVNIRKEASISSESIGIIKAGTALKVSKEVFTSSKSASLKNRWYAVKAGKKRGYIRADLVKITKYGNKKAVTIDDLNYRAGAGTSMSRKGTVSYSSLVKVLLPASAAGSDTVWYKVQIGNNTGYMSGDYLNFSFKVAPEAKGKKGIARDILSFPTDGGKARIIGALDATNCKKRFNVTGHRLNRVPQGMAYTGNKYYIIFGMSDSQSIVTYSSGGKRLSAVKFPYNMGKPNAITWNPITKCCYILRGQQNMAHVWDPSSKKFSTVKTPYSSSGISYDRATRKLYATSLTGVRVYSADGTFNHEGFFAKCSHSGTSYVHDCGAYGGFIFHGVSGAYKFGTNYLDIYRAKDGKYLGSFQVNLGEIESVIVNNKGYVELLFNNGGTFKETIWQTPINVKNLM